jgi:hypothetical protein
MRIVAMVAAVMLATATPTEAAQTGGSLKSLCESETDAYQAVCTGYIIAIADILTQFSLDGGLFLGWRACMPKIGAMEAQAAVVEFLNAHPDTADRAAFSLVSRALAEAYPCE